MTLVYQFLSGLDIFVVFRLFRQNENWELAPNARPMLLTAPDEYLWPANGRFNKMKITSTVEGFWMFPDLVKDALIRTGALGQRLEQHNMPKICSSCDKFEFLFILRAIVEVSITFIV
ncbi:hypothetical protein NE237_028598 [Protea cynaroides]|uniref:Uncharacterized protein n=1 Tax=Protea cynaroides TaxID=273540 RepID=A0A9Q0JTZ6_9MAGN|nr:hypothetical protein NE237_028598 [Protea cynaroides]